MIPLLKGSGVNVFSVVIVLKIALWAGPYT